MKAGWFARKMKKKRGIRYVVTEHWTGYLPGAVPSLRDMGRVYRMMNNNVLQHASMLIPVSKNLGECLSATGISVPQQVIPNVVDTALFRFEPATAGPFRFVHFSYLNRQKNPEGILQACAILQSRGLDFECRLMGAASPELEKEIIKKGLASVVSVLPEMPHEEVAVAMRSAQALVMFSRFENLPCVVLEALCSGLPVVSSNVGGLSEVINESNGLLVPEGDVEALAAAMESVLNDYARFNRRGIAESAAALFNTKRIGEAHQAIYRELAGL
jgi:glycosyltransferase involved in cell wall biosynthesis